MKKTNVKNSKKSIHMFAVAAIVLAVACAVVLFAVFGNSSRENNGNDVHYVRIDIENYGVVVAELDEAAAPDTVNNFLNLVDSGFYDGLTFHRIIDGFMIQGGDPKGNGTGGSSQKIKGEFKANGFDNPIKHERGVLSMARSAAYDSASSQFFIMHKEAAHLDGQYAAFGRVISGMEAVDTICKSVPVTDHNGTVLKADQPVITSIKRIEKPAE